MKHSQTFGYVLVFQISAKTMGLDKILDLQKLYICNKYATLQMTTLNLHIFWNDSIWLQIICLKTCYNRGFTVVHRGSISYSVPEIAH